MAALWRARALWRSSGSAEVEISIDFGSPEGSWTACTAVIFPPLIVTFSWTGPYWVCTASPVTLPEALGDEDVRVDDVVVGGAAAVVVVAGTGRWAWKPRVAARPAAVAARTMGARGMGSGLRGRQKEKDSWCRCVAGTPASA